MIEVSASKYSGIPFVNHCDQNLNTKVIYCWETWESDWKQAGHKGMPRNSQTTTKPSGASLQSLPCGTGGRCFLQLLLPLPLLLWKLEFAAAPSSSPCPLEQLQFPSPRPGNVSGWSRSFTVAAKEARKWSGLFGFHGGLCFSWRPL